MSQSQRPPLYVLEQAARRRRRTRRRRPRLLSLAALLAIAAVTVLAGFVLVRVMPLTRTGAGLISDARPRWGPQVTAEHGKPPPGIWAVHVSHRRISGVEAAAAIAVDARSGRVLWGHDIHRRRPIGSLTKLMTALIVDRSGLHGGFPVTAPMTGSPGDVIGLRPGQRVTVARMLAAMLIASANDAADALAVHTAGNVEAFVRLMNHQAMRLRLGDTRYSNASGIYDQGNHSSAWDVADLARRVLRRPRLAKLVRTQVYATGPTTQYVNLNRLLWTYPGAIGVKTGSTSAAGNCVAAAARHGRRSVIAVLLDARGNPFSAAAHLLDWGFRHVGR